MDLLWLRLQLVMGHIDVALGSSGGDAGTQQTWGTSYMIFLRALESLGCLSTAGDGLGSMICDGALPSWPF